MFFCHVFIFVIIYGRIQGHTLYELCIPKIIQLLKNKQLSTKLKQIESYLILDELSQRIYIRFHLFTNNGIKIKKK